jgi:hypothetical protein
MAMISEHLVQNMNTFLNYVRTLAVDMQKLAHHLEIGLF